MKNYSSMTRITPMIFFMFPIKQKVMCYWNLGSQNLICGLWLSVWNQEVVFFRCFPWCSIKPERYLNLLRSWKAQTRVHYCLYFKIQCHFQNMDDFITTFLPFLCYQFVKLNQIQIFRFLISRPFKTGLIFMRCTLVEFACFCSSRFNR